MQEYKKARKEAAKEQKQKALQEKRGAIDTMLAGMTDEGRKQWHEKNKVWAWRQLDMQGY